jgi:hypothetical protein
MLHKPSNGTRTFNERGNMSEIILDHVGDANGAELHRLSKLYGLPDFVKQADFTAVLRPGEQPVAVYADPRTKHYPCQDAASTFLSCLFFEEKQGHYHPNNRTHVRERLDHYVEYWGIKEAVDAVRAVHGETHKNANDLLPDSDFAFVRVLKDGHKQRHWRLKNSKEVRAAAETLFKYRDTLPFSDRHVISQKILTKAAQYGADLGEYDGFIERQAGRGVCDPEQVEVMLMGRAKIAKDAQQRQMITKLAETAASKPSASLTPDMLIKLANTVDMVDRASGLAGRYSDALPRPEDVIFAVTYKEATAGVSTSCALTTGSIYDKSQFSKVSAEDLANLFGPDIVGQVTTGLDVDPEKLAEIAATLPRGDAEVFEQLLQEAGVPPMAHKAASAHAGLSPTILASLAQNYRQPAMA